MTYIPLDLQSDISILKNLLFKLNGIFKLFLFMYKISNYFNFFVRETVNDDPLHIISYSKQFESVEILLSNYADQICLRLHISCLPCTSSYRL